MGFDAIEIDTDETKLYINDNQDIIITGEINNDIYHNLIIGLRKIENQNTQKSLKSQNKQIVLFLNTFGGDLCVAFGIYDYFNYLKSIGYCINTYITSHSYSSGTIIACGSTNSYMTKNANLMIHEYSVDIGYAKHDDIEQSKVYGDNLLKKMLKIYNNRCKIKVTKSHLKKDWYINADEALKLGFIDKIL